MFLLDDPAAIIERNLSSASNCACVSVEHRIGITERRLERAAGHKTRHCPRRLQRLGQWSSTRSNRCRPAWDFSESPRAPYQNGSVRFFLQAMGWDRAKTSGYLPRNICSRQHVLRSTASGA